MIEARPWKTHGIVEIPCATHLKFGQYSGYLLVNPGSFFRNLVAPIPPAFSQQFEKRGISEILLQIGEFVGRGAKHLGHRKVAGPEVTGKRDERPVLRRTGVDHPDNGPAIAGKPVNTAIRAVSPQRHNLGGFGDKVPAI